MWKTLFILFLTCLLVNFCYAGGKCQIYYEYGYIAGHEGGIEDRENGYKCVPEEAYNLPLIQITLKVIKEKLKSEENYIDEYEFDRCLKEGFLVGYRDGYHGHHKKKMEYSW